MAAPPGSPRQRGEFTAFLLLADEIGSGQVPRSEMCDLALHNGAVILLLDADDRLLGLEILGASRVLPKELLSCGEST
jgi:hypothetical protein